MFKEANKLKIIFILFLILILMGNIYAHEEETDPGILPDSIFWGLDKAFDSLSLALTANNEEKAKKGISIAMERIAEIKSMLSQNKIEHSVKAKDATSRTLLKVKEKIASIEKEDKTQELEKTLEIEKELGEIENELEEIKETEIKIKIKGQLSDEQLQKLKSIVTDLAGQSSEIEVEIKNKKDKTKIEIKSKTDTDVDKLEEELEKKHGLVDKKKAKAEEQLEEAKEDLFELEALISEGAPKSTLQLLSEAREKIENSEAALIEGKFGEAFGQANAAKNILENAEKQLEVKDEEELEIEVEIKEGFAKIKVEIGDEELKFNIFSTDKEEIIKEIADELGLTAEEITQLIDFEDEEDFEDKDLEKELKKLKREDIPGEKPNFDKIFEDEEESKEQEDDLKNQKDFVKNEKDSNGKYSEKGNSGKAGSNGKDLGDYEDEDDNSGGY